MQREVLTGVKHPAADRRRDAGWSTGRRVAIVATATLIAVVLILGSIEAGARLYVYLAHGVAGKTYGLWRYDEVLGAQHRENAYNTHTQTNDHGFRNRRDVIDPKPEGAIRVITYGGSTTFCYNLDDDEAWPARLEQALRANTGNESHQVLNAGAIMWSIGHAYARAQKDIPALKPDYVVIYSGINEHSNSYYLEAADTPMEALVKQGRYGVFATNLDQNRWIKRNLVTIKALEYRVIPKLARVLDPLIGRSSPPAVGTSGFPEAPDPFLLDNYLRVLDDFLTLISTQGATAVFVSQAHDGQLKWNRYLTSYSRAGATLASRHGAVVVNGEQVVEDYVGDPGDLFHTSGRHFSSLGAEKFSALLFTQIFAAP